MLLTGKLSEMYTDWKTNKMKVTIETDDCVPGALQELGETVDINLKQHKENRRSENANRYFHMLCGRIAREKTIHGENTSLAKVKNELVGRYGQRELINGDTVKIFTNAPEDYMTRLEGGHVVPVGKNSKGMFAYKLYRGTSDYTSAEMSNLIKGTVDEARKLGIETEDPAYIEYLINNWNGKKND